MADSEPQDAVPQPEPDRTPDPTAEPSAAQPESARPLSAAEERLQLERLRLEVERLRRRNARHPARTVPAVLLIVLACVLAPLAIVAAWANDFVGNTDRYVQTVTPLAQDPVVQSAVTDEVSRLIVQKVDLPSVVDSAVSALKNSGVAGPAASALGALSGPIESALSGFIHSTVAKVVASPAFATVWVQVNKQAHQAVVQALTGQSGAVQLHGNAVTIDLAPLIEQVKGQLVGAGFGLAANIPPIHTSFTVFTSDAIPKVKTGFRLLQVVGNWLPITAVLIGAAGVFLAVRRRNALIGAALGVLAGLFVLAVAISVGRTVAVQQLPANTSEPAATAVIDTLLRFLWGTIRAFAALAVVVALGAFLSGPTHPARWVRHYCVLGIDWLRAQAVGVGMRLGPVPLWVHRFHDTLTWFVVLLAALVFATWTYPTVAVVVWITLFVLLGLLILQFLDEPQDRTDRG